MTSLYKLFILIIIISTASNMANAQRKPNDPKHENHYRVLPIENEDVKIEFEDCHSQQAFTLAKLKITNKTSDYILVKTNELIFKYAFGEFQGQMPITQGLFSKDIFFIEPNAVVSRTLKVTGNQNFHVEKLSFVPRGFYKIKLPGDSVNISEFTLPPVRNEFVTNKFKCQIDKLKKETKETKVSFKCTYLGNDVGILNASNIAIAIESGDEFANDTMQSRDAILLSNESATISASFHIPARTVDMQFANMTILWRNTFRESKQTQLSLPSADFILDPGKTEGKNR